MAEPIVQDLELDLNPALQALSTLDQALEAISATFATSLSEAVAAAVGEPLSVEVTADTDAATAAIDEATAPRDIEVSADTEEITVAIDEAAAPRDVPLNADTGGVVDELDTLLATPFPLPLSADMQELLSQIETFEPPPVEVPVVTSPVEPDDSVPEATEDLNDYEAATTAVAAATGLASGSVDLLNTSISAMGKGAAAWTAVATTLGAFTIGLANSAIEAETAESRLNATLGEQAERIDALNVPGLASDLDDLAIKTGNSDENLRLAAARIGELGQSAGATDEQIGSTAETIDLLAVRLSVVNPTLGDAGAIADRLTGAFARGGRALAPFGIALSSSQIAARALADTGKDTVDQLTLFDKSAAGAALALEQLGGKDQVFADIDEAADGSAIRVRALRTAIGETLEALGAPLVGPGIDLIEDLAPIAQRTGELLGGLARVALPFLNALAPVLIPVGAALDLVGDGLDLIADGLEAIPLPVLSAFVIGLTAAAVATGALDFALVGLSTALATNPITLPLVAITAGLAALGAATRLFDDDSDGFEASVEGMREALFAASGSGDLFANNIRVASEAYEQFLRKKADAGELDDLDRILERTGANFRDVSRAITGTETDFERFKARSLEPLLSRLSDVQRAAFERGGIAGLVARARTEASLNEWTVEEADLLAAIIDTNDGLDAQREEFVALAEQQIQGAFRAGDITQAQLEQLEATAHATTGTRGYGAALDQLASLLRINREEQRNATLSTLEMSGAFDDLRVKLLNGAISAEEAQRDLVGMGLSADDAATFVQGVTGAVRELTDSIVGQLPTAGDAVSEFRRGVVDAFTELARARDDTGAVDSAADRLAAAQRRLTEVERQGAGDTEESAKSHAEAIRRAREEVDRANRELIEARNADADEIEAAQQRLEHAADPTRFIESLFDSARTSEQFLANLEKVAEFAPALAATLAQQGPEAAGALAEAFANDKNKAIFAEAGLRAGESVKNEFKRFIEDDLAQEVIGPAEQTGDVLGSGVNLGFATGLKIEEITEEALKPSIAARAEARLSGAKLGASMHEGFEAGLREGEEAVERAAAAIVTDAELAVRRRAGISSPSRLFAELGNALSEGVEVGILAGLPRVSLAGDRLVSAASARLNAAAAGPVGDLVVAAPAAAPRAPAAVAAPASGDGSGGGDRALVGQVVFNEKIDPLHVAAELAWRTDG